MAFLPRLIYAFNTIPVKPRKASSWKLTSCVYNLHGNSKDPHELHGFEKQSRFTQVTGKEKLFVALGREPPKQPCSPRAKAAIIHESASRRAPGQGASTQWAGTAIKGSKWQVHTWTAEDPQTPRVQTSPDTAHCGVWTTFENKQSGSGTHLPSGEGGAAWKLAAGRGMSRWLMLQVLRGLVVCHHPSRCSFYLMEL